MVAALGVIASDALSAVWVTIRVPCLQKFACVLRIVSSMFGVIILFLETICYFDAGL